MAEKYLWKSSSFRKWLHLHKRFADIFRNMHFLWCDKIYRLQISSVGGAHKVLEISSKIVLEEVQFAVNLYSFPQANPSITQVSHLPPSQTEQLLKLLLPLDTSTIALVCIFFSILSNNLANQKN